MPCIEPEAAVGARACAGSELTGGNLKMVESSDCAGSGLTDVVTGGANGVSVSELWSEVEPRAEENSSPRACTGSELTGTEVTDEPITLLGSVS